MTGLELAVVVCASLAAGALGLWWGERGRRRAAENVRTYGTPERTPARVMVPPVDAEQRAAELGREISAETIERGAQQLLEESRRLGRPLSPEIAREMAMQMLGLEPGEEATL